MDRKTGNTAVSAIHRVTFHAGSTMSSSHAKIAMPARLKSATYIRGLRARGVGARREGETADYERITRMRPSIQSGVPAAPREKRTEPRPGFGGGSGDARNGGSGGVEHQQHVLA